MKFRSFLKSVLMLALVVSFASVQGCSWFGGGDDDAVDVSLQGTEMDGAGSELPPPADAEADGPRPTELVLMEDMKTIYFDYDRSQIRPDQLELIDYNLRYLVANPEVKVLIEGHCDERGTIEYNFALGHRRANSVREYFIKNGILPERLSVRSKGEEEPVDAGHGEAAWSQNRRCIFYSIH